MSLQKAWQSRGALAYALWPVSMLMRLLVAIRRIAFKLGLRKQQRFVLPVVVVGNISVGGTGKSPVTASLVRYLQHRGWQPGIVARGYGGTSINTPRLVNSSSDPQEVGDEPVMLAHMTQVPVCVCRNRPEAIAVLTRDTQVNIVISDDGLQHYAMWRDVEIAVIDAQHGLGNGWLLPAGPLREARSRLASVDLIAVHKTLAENTVAAAESLNLPAAVATGRFHLETVCVRSVESSSAAPKELALSTFAGMQVHAVAGIGDPERFFKHLERADICVERHPKPDHHDWTLADLIFTSDEPIFITSKDAVKVRKLLQHAPDTSRSIFEVCVQAEWDEALTQSFSRIEKQLAEQYLARPST